MTIAKKGESQKDIINEFIRELEETAKQVHKLLEEINESKVDFAEIKTELRILVDNVKELSGLVRDSDQGAGVLTRVAIIEKNIEDLKNYTAKDSVADTQFTTKIALVEASLEKTSAVIRIVFKKIDKLEEKNQYIDNRLVKLEENKEIKNRNLAKTNELAVIDKTGKWKLYSIVATGIITFVVAITTLVIKLFFG